MLKLAGKVIDIHDDPTFKTMLDALPRTTLREKFGSTKLYEPAELAMIPDSRIGAIFFDSNVIGGWEKRAYPLHEPDHAELSALYFTKAAESGVFPVAVRNQIASQISHGLQMHDIPVPESIEKWAEEYGDWVPSDNFIDVRMVREDEVSANDLYAFAKTSGDHRFSVLPCGTPEETADSIRALLAEDGPEDLGLDRFETMKAASALKYAAERHGMKPPKDLVKIACVDERDAADVGVLLTERLRLLPEDMSPPRMKLAHDTVHQILKEASAEKKVALLSAFDTTFGIGERAYGSGVSRPFDVVFAPAVAKQASQDDLIVSMGGIDRIKAIVGDETAQAFEKDAAAALKTVKAPIRAVLLHGIS